MSKVIDYVRRLAKALTTPGQVATIPPTDDHTEGGWIESDIYNRELLINLPDEILYTRYNNKIIRLNLDILPKLWFSTINDIRAIEIRHNDGNCACYGNGVIYKYDSSSILADDGLNVLKPNNVTGSGRWIKVLKIKLDLIPDNWVQTIVNLREIADHDNGVDCGVYDTQTLYQYDSSLMNPDDGVIYIKPNNVLPGDPGRWLKKFKYSDNHLTNFDFQCDQSAIKNNTVFYIFFDNTNFSSIQISDIKTRLWEPWFADFQSNNVDLTISYKYYEDSTDRWLKYIETIYNERNDPDFTSNVVFISFINDSYSVYHDNNAIPDLTGQPTTEFTNDYDSFKDIWVKEFESFLGIVYALPAQEGSLTDENKNFRLHLVSSIEGETVTGIDSIGMPGDEINIISNPYSSLGTQLKKLGFSYQQNFSVGVTGLTYNQFKTDIDTLISSFNEVNLKYILDFFNGTQQIVEKNISSCLYKGITDLGVNLNVKPYYDFYKVSFLKNSLNVDFNQPKPEIPLTYSIDNMFVLLDVNGILISGSFDESIGLGMFYKVGNDFITLNFSNKNDWFYELENDDYLRISYYHKDGIPNVTQELPVESKVELTGITHVVNSSNDTTFTTNFNNTGSEDEILNLILSLYKDGSTTPEASVPFVHIAVPGNSAFDKLYPNLSPGTYIYSVTGDKSGNDNVIIIPPVSDYTYHTFTAVRSGNDLVMSVKVTNSGIIESVLSAWFRCIKDSTSTILFTEKKDHNNIAVGETRTFNYTYTNFFATGNPGADPDTYICQSFDSIP